MKNFQAIGVRVCAVVLSIFGAAQGVLAQDSCPISDLIAQSARGMITISEQLDNPRPERLDIIAPFLLLQYGDLQAKDLPAFFARLRLAGTPWRDVTELGAVWWIAKAGLGEATQKMNISANHPVYYRPSVFRAAVVHGALATYLERAAKSVEDGRFPFPQTPENVTPRGWAWAVHDLPSEVVLEVSEMLRAAGWQRISEDVSTAKQDFLGARYLDAESVFVSEVQGAMGRREGGFEIESALGDAPIESLEQIEDMWLVSYDAMAADYGAVPLGEALRAIDIGPRIGHFAGNAAQVIDWFRLRQTFRPYMSGAQDGLPEELPFMIDFKTGKWLWYLLAPRVKMGNIDVEPGRLPLQVELLALTGDWQKVMDLTVWAEPLDVKLSLYRDMLRRMDGTCKAASRFPASVRANGGVPLIRFDPDETP